MNSYIRVLHAVVRGASLKEEAEKALIQHIGAPGKAMIGKFDKAVERWDIFCIHPFMLSNQTRRPFQCVLVTTISKAVFTSPSSCVR